MANKQDIITAIKNLDHFLKVPALNGATARINKNGGPFVYVGGFNMVFQLTHKSKKWAFRVWHVPMGENEERYFKISEYLTSKKLPYFAEFIYDEKGILINGELVDTIRMEWLDGMLLKDYIETNLRNPSSLVSLADKFLKMCRELQGSQISHGDLQEGNILINGNGNIKLVDYDSICVPEIEGQQELVTGLKGYQHPSRFIWGKASLKADYFSELIIYLSILALAEKPELWNKYQIKDTQYLLFSETDFEDFVNSKIYKDLGGVSLKVDRLLSVLVEYIKTNSYLDLEPFSRYLEPPTIKSFFADREVLMQGGEITISWDVENANDIEINEGIGKVNQNGSLTLNPRSDKSYKITAINSFGTAEKQFQILTFPTPVLESLKVPMPDFTSRVNFSDIQINSPKINLSINLFPLMRNEPIFMEPSVELKTLRPRYKPQTEFLNLSNIYESIRRKISR